MLVMMPTVEKVHKRLPTHIMEDEVHFEMTKLSSEMSGHIRI